MQKGGVPVHRGAVASGRTDSYRVVWIILYAVLALGPLGLALTFGPSQADEKLLFTIGLRAALVGFVVLVLQVALAGRFKFLDHVFGIDAVTQFHKAMGITAAGLLLAHPVLMAAARGNLRLFSMGTPWQVDLGKLALSLLIATVLFAFLFRQMGVDYNVWRFSHKAVIFVLIFGFAHSYLIGPDLQSAEMRLSWWFLFILAACIFMYRNVYIPLWGRRRFEVTAVGPETHNTHTLTFASKGGRPLLHNPGQFMFLKLKRPGRPSQIHPFTISSSSLQGDTLQATIKQSGNFTNTIGQTRPGDTGIIEAPFGRFSLVRFDAEKFLFIAGGVGITPIMSMLRYLRDTNDHRPAVLLYGNRTEKDMIFRDELDGLPGNVQVVHVLSQPEGSWPGAKGHITADLIQQHAPDYLPQAHIFVCGPGPMMRSVVRSLRDKGVSRRRIHYEHFTV